MGYGKIACALSPFARLRAKIFYINTPCSAPSVASAIRSASASASSASMLSPKTLSRPMSNKAGTASGVTLSVRR